MSALLIDTSSENVFLAVSKNGKIVCQKTISDSRQLSKFLLPSIETLWQDFDYITVGIGPGSYTGTRIGVIVAKSLSFALDAPLIGFSSTLLPDLETIASFSFEKFQKKSFDSQIELVYFPLTP